jgi:U3 small nucleolar RNA-associated protein 7
MSVVDINTQKKVFNLVLKQQAPYSVQYTQSGRYLLLGGQRGHISSIRWRDFEMKSEVYVNETVRAIQWMMDDSMYAVAQSPMTYVYNEKGVEIHCCKDFYKVDYLTYLPFHFLLVGAVSLFSHANLLDIRK